jgi:hypothetical protein
MLRKLVSAIIVFALATMGLSAASPAQAAGTFSPTVALPEAAGYATSIPLGDDAQLKLWQGYDDNGHYLKTGILHSDGTWANQPDLATGSTSTNFLVGGEGSWAVSQEGTIAFTWIQSTNNNSTTTTSVSYIAYTDDGIDWSAPVQVLAPRVSNGDFMVCMMMGCGYNSLKLSIDSKGTLAAFANYRDGGNSSFIVSTSLDGANWSSPTELESATGWGGGYYLNIAPLPAGGFLAAWVASTGETQSFKYSTMSPTNFNFWKRPKVLGSAPSINSAPVMIQTDPTHVSLFYVTGNPGPVLRQQLYDLTSKTWGASTSILTGPWDLIDSSLQVSMGKNWHGALGVGLVRNGAQEGKSYVVELNNSVPSEAKVAKSVAQQKMTIDAIRVNFDDSITMMMSGINRPANIMTFKAGVLVSDEDIPNTPASQIYSFSVTVSPSGNFFISGTVNLGTSQIYEGIVYRAASAPIPVGTLKLTGTAKTGQTVTSKIPTFTGVSNIGTTRIQWYSCTTKTATVQLTIPLNCAAIPKATALKFKVTAKQKNKYLGVAVSNTNAVGTATLFTTLATKAK